MKKDIDLSRKILLFVEEHSPPEGGLDKPLEIDGYNAPTVRAHVDLLIKGGYLEGRVMSGPNGINVVDIRRLTNLGHDAIKAIEEESIWGKVKRGALQKGVPLTIDIAAQWAKAEIRARLPHL